MTSKHAPSPNNKPLTSSGDPALAEGLLLSGLDGANPLAFLAALGAFRLLSLAWPQRNVKMAWTVHLSAWRPTLQADLPLTPEKLVDILTESCQRGLDAPCLHLGDDIAAIAPQDFRKAALKTPSMASPSQRTDADFLAAFACEATLKDGVLQDTALRTMSGAGHQHFLKFMRNIVAHTEAHHLYKALFEVWRYDDPVKNHTLRWDPVEDIRYALQAKNPSKGHSREKRGSMWGANRMAIEGMPMLPTIPLGTTLHTTAFYRRSRPREYFLLWPIWRHPQTLDVTRSTLAMAELLRLLPSKTATSPLPKSAKNDIQQLHERGIVVVYCSKRITVGKFRNFSPAESIM